MTKTADDGRRRTDGEPRADTPRMREVQHTHPITGESFQDAYWRGPVVADGGAGEQAPDEVSHPSPRSDESTATADGESAASDDEASQPADAEGDQPAGEMRDVDHTPPSEEASANRVWERGSGADDADNETATDETADR